MNLKIKKMDKNEQFTKDYSRLFLERFSKSLSKTISFPTIPPLPSIKNVLKLVKSKN